MLGVKSTNPLLLPSYPFGTMPQAFSLLGPVHHSHTLSIVDALVDMSVKGMDIIVFCNTPRVPVDSQVEHHGLQ